MTQAPRCELQTVIVVVIKFKKNWQTGFPMDANSLTINNEHMFEVNFK